MRRRVEDYEYVIRDAAGFIRALDHASDTYAMATMRGHHAAINLGLKVE